MVSHPVRGIRSSRELVNKKRPSSSILGGGNYTPDGEKVMVSRLVGGIRSRRELISKGRPSSSIWGGKYTPDGRKGDGQRSGGGNPLHQELINNPKLVSPCLIHPITEKNTVGLGFRVANKSTRPSNLKAQAVNEKGGKGRRKTTYTVIQRSGFGINN